MTDRELLKLAEKAAGYEINFDEPAGMVDYYPHGYDEYGDVDAWWNPLESNGDAFSLAVCLNMSLEISEYEDSTYAYAGAVPRVYGYEIWKGDKESATRRAIVSAAAQVGESMP